jgi:hypothetical protein
MRNKTSILALALIAVFGTSALFPGAVLAQRKAAQNKAAQNRQKNKNNWRNLAGVGAAVTGYGLLKGNKTAVVLGTAGAAYSANRYEQDRKSQSKANAARQNARYHRRGNMVRNGRKYYTYNGRQYYMNLQTGARHRVNALPHAGSRPKDKGR